MSSLVSPSFLGGGGFLAHFVGSFLEIEGIPSILKINLDELLPLEFVW